MFIEARCIVRVELSNPLSIGTMAIKVLQFMLVVENSACHRILANSDPLLALKVHLLVRKKLNPGANGISNDSSVS